MPDTAIHPIQDHGRTYAGGRKRAWVQAEQEHKRPGGVQAKEASFHQIGRPRWSWSAKKKSQLLDARELRTLVDQRSP